MRDNKMKDASPLVMVFYSWCLARSCSCNYLVNTMTAEVGRCEQHWKCWSAAILPPHANKIFRVAKVPNPKPIIPPSPPSSIINGFTTITTIHSGHQYHHSIYIIYPIFIFRNISRTMNLADASTLNTKTNNPNSPTVKIVKIKKTT